MTSKPRQTIIILLLLSMGCTAPSLFSDHHEQQFAGEQESSNERQPGTDAEKSLLEDINRWSPVPSVLKYWNDQINYVA